MRVETTLSTKERQAGSAKRADLAERKGQSDRASAHRETGRHLARALEGKSHSVVAGRRQRRDLVVATDLQATAASEVAGQVRL